ncbi:MAG: C_GCAxxG_C_C family protein [Magnetococcales bacterium]|nr:C_GCAxxG_C_C family protein [Magnetococcales bacterium]
MADRPETDAATLAGTVGQRAEAHYKGGLCCSEALFLAATEGFGTGPAPPERAALAAGLCGGMGNRQATCGVFTGGAVAVGFLVGKTSLQDRDKTVRTLVARFQERLEREAGAHVCRDLLDRFGPVGNLNKRLCRKLTRRGAEILTDLLLENGVKPREPGSQGSRY